MRRQEQEMDVRLERCSLRGILKYEAVGLVFIDCLFGVMKNDNLPVCYIKTALLVATKAACFTL